MMLRKSVLLDDDAQDASGGGDDKPAAKPAAKPADAKPAGPATVPAVKKTPNIKTPEVIALEKKLAVAEDKIDSLESSIEGISAALEGLQVGGPKPVEIRKGKVKPTKGGFFEQVDADIWGTAPEA